MNKNYIQIINLLIKHPSEKKILVVKRNKPDKTFGGMYALPGGGIEEGETFEETAKRELCKETGVELKSINLVPFMTSTLKIGEKAVNIGIFYAEIEGSDFEPEDSDIEKVEFIKASELIGSLRANNYPSKETDKLEKYFKNSSFYR